MLLLVFHLGNDRYAIETGQVLEVLPLVNVKQVPHAPAGVAGMFDYHGAYLPLIDLSDLALGTPSRNWMSTRIIVVNYGGGPGGARAFGLLAEQATEILRRNEEDFKDPGLALNGTPYLGKVTTDAGGLVQLIAVEKLLSDGLSHQLFREQAGVV